MTPKSAKAKGRVLQNWLADSLRDFFAEYLKDGDIKPAIMGETGADIKFSPLAQLHIPYQFECKNKAKYAVYTDYEQACEHGELEPVLIIKENGKRPLAVVDAVHFLSLIEQLERPNAHKTIS